MENPSTGWWSKHGPTLLLLLAAFSISFLVRTLWNLPLLQEFGSANLFAGGSDSFYHWRVTDYIILNHRNLVVDPLLKYPFSAYNPREPLFDWMNAVFGILAAPLFGGNAAAAGQFSLELAGPLWAALSVFPIYLIGKEVNSRRMGLVAALIWPFLVANIDSSTFAYANYLSFYTFFILVMVYSYLRTVRAAGSRRFVPSYRKPRDIVHGIREWVRVEAIGLRWSVFTGVCFGAVILAWQGYTFLVAIVIVFLVVQMIIERVRRVDSLGLYLSTWVVGIVGFPMAFPFYYLQGDYHIWFFEPVLIYFGALLILLPFLLLRDAPWVISIPVLVGTAGAAIAGIAVAAPATFGDLISGQGYFVKTLIYSTVAEAQAPSIDSLIIGYGVVTFFLAFAGLAFVAWQLARGRFQRRHLLFLVFAVVSIYLPVSAAKFFYLGSAAFSLLPAEALSRLLDVGGYPELRRNVASLSDRRSQLGAFRRSFKARHVLVPMLIVLIVLPNVWYGIDAGIPYNAKGQYDTQIYNSLPAPLRVSPSNASSYYLGAGGSQIDTSHQYDEAGYDWLAQQDTNIPEPQRPALVSWWDYGFQTISEGLHPAVADNFQNGIDPSGNFLLAQNESLAIGVLATTLLSAEEGVSGQPYLPASLNSQLAADGVDLATLHSLLVNQSNDVQLVVSHPGRYLAVDPNHIDGQNAMYDAVSYFLATTLPSGGVAQVYDTIQAYTGWTVRYDMVDTRLIPFSGSNTGIFYAPADLTDRVINAGGEPSTYFNVSVVGSDGNTYNAGSIPAGITPVSYNIAYNAPYYDSMIYRTFFGYNGSDVGQGSGIPGLQGNIGSDNPEPGWMLQHFQVVYRTAYACPQKNATPGSSCFVAMNLPEANHLAAKENWTADTASSTYYQAGGEAILEYYPGETVRGVVSLPNGRPDPNVRVTVYDSWGIPHMTTTTASDGSYSLILPPGNDTLNVTAGPIDLLKQAGSTALASINVTVPNAVGLSLVPDISNLPIVLKPSTVQGTVFWTSHNDTTFNPSVDTPVNGATVTLWGPGIHNLSTTTDNQGTFKISQVPPATYNVTVREGASWFNQSAVTVGPGATRSINASLSAGIIKGHVSGPGGSAVANATIDIASAGTIVGTELTGKTGNYSITDLGPGNYSVTATLASRHWGALAAAAHIVHAGDNDTADLTIGPIGPVSVTVLRNGLPVAGVPVRFSEILPVSSSPGPTPGNGSSGPIGTGSGPQDQAKAPSVVATTDSDGVATAVVPWGNYSIYSFGLGPAGYWAGFWSGPVGYGASAPPPLPIVPAVELSGTIANSSAASLSAPNEIQLYNSAGEMTWAFTNLTDAWSIWLPPGPYTLNVYQPGPPPAGWIQTVNLQNATHLALSTFPGTVAVGSVADASTALPIAGATVEIVAQPSGATITVHSDPTGVFTAPTPTSLIPNVATSYCVNVSAPGYGTTSSCNNLPPSLNHLSPSELSPLPVPVRVRLTGLPAGSPVQVNLTAASVGARSVSVRGVSPLTTSLLPGNYTVTAWAPAGASGLWLPPSPVPLHVAIGSAGPSVTVPLLLQFRSAGSVSVPSGLTAASATVRLVSAAMNLTLSETEFTHGFYAAAGTYTYYAAIPTVAAQGGWVALGQLTVSSNGQVSPTISIESPALPITATVSLPTGKSFQPPVPPVFSDLSGLSIPFATSNGTVTVLLPINETFHVALDFTAVVPTSNTTTALESLHLLPSQVCEVEALGASCDLALHGSPINATVSGTALIASSGLGVSSTVMFDGPIPSTSITKVSTSSNGSWSVGLAPGNYSVYTVAAGGTYAALSSIFVGTSAVPGIVLSLRPAWSATVLVSPPPGQSVGRVVLTFAAATGIDLPIAGYPINAPVATALPPGLYTVSAGAPSSPYGVPTNATAGSTLSLLNGNAAITLRLSEVLTHSVDVELVWSNGLRGNLTLPPTGGIVSYPFTIRNTGNAPVNVTLSGSPEFWNFTILPRNFSLTATGGGSLSGGTVTIRVPAGTPVAHAAISLTADLAGTNSSIGTSFPAHPPPPLVILPQGGVRIGVGSSLKPTFTPTTIAIPVYVLNTGNIVEGVQVAVADGSRLAGLGWTATVRSGSTTQTAPLLLLSQGNSSLTVDLNATPGGVALPPGSVTLSALVVNATLPGVFESIVVPLPTVTVGLGSNGTSLTVTGPSVGSPPMYPDSLTEALVFLPALVVLVAAVVHRWYRTRRWRR